jgi:hypothetical protein
MPSLLFTNTLMLAGMAALAIPILIHLLLRRRKKLVPFSTVRFFRQQDEQSTRRRKLCNWLLLALRVLIVSLLVLAFARPYSRQNQASAADRKEQRVVFVLDNSASMLATGTEGQRWALAKERMQKVISSLQEGDAVALIECGVHANVISGFSTPAAVVPVLRDLKSAYGTCDLLNGLQQAVRLLAGGLHNSIDTIYLVTDLQKSACRGLSACPIPQEIEFKLLPIGDLSSPNLAILRLDAEGREGTPPQVSVGNFSDEDSPSVALDVAIDDHPLTPRVIGLKAGSSTNLDIRFPALKPGWHDLKAKLRTRDAFEADNTRYGSLFVPEPAQVLMVEPRASARVFEQASFFLSSALDPMKDSTNSVPGSFNLTQVSPERLAGELSGSNDSVSGRVVVIPGLTDIPTGIRKSLMTFVQGGGGLILFLGEGMSANRYNSEFMDLLPARIGNPDQNLELGSAWRIAIYETNSLAFSAFRLPNSGDLRIPEFTKRYTLEELEGTTRLAFFDDGVPLVVARAVGKGRVALVNASADTAWTDWPKHKTFVPFVHGLTKLVAQRSNNEPVQDNNSYVAGEDFEIETGAQGGLAKFILQTPSGNEAHLTADKQGRLHDPGMVLPGIYSLRDGSGHELRRMAVNLPAQESNLEALRSTDFMQQLVRSQETPKQTLAAGLFGSRHDRREFWIALLLGALILLLIEPFLANRTSI